MLLGRHAMHAMHIWRAQLDVLTTGGLVHEDDAGICYQLHANGQPLSLLHTQACRHMCKMSCPAPDKERAELLLLQCSSESVVMVAPSDSMTKRTAILQTRF